MSSFGVPTGTTIEYSSPCLASRALTDSRSILGYKSSRRSAVDSPQLKGLQRWRMDLISSGSGAVTSSIAGAEPRGGREELISFRSGGMASYTLLARAQRNPGGFPSIQIDEPLAEQEELELPPLSLHGQCFPSLLIVRPHFEGGRDHDCFNL